MRNRLPFANKINYIPDVPFGAAKQLLELLNQFGVRYRRDLSSSSSISSYFGPHPRNFELETRGIGGHFSGELRPPRTRSRSRRSAMGRTRLDEKEAEEIDRVWDEWMEGMWVRHQELKEQKRENTGGGPETEQQEDGELTLGYVTTDVRLSLVHSFLSSFLQSTWMRRRLITTPHKHRNAQEWETTYPTNHSHSSPVRGLSLLLPLRKRRTKSWWMLFILILLNP